MFLVSYTFLKGLWYPKSFLKSVTLVISGVAYKARISATISVWLTRLDLTVLFILSMGRVLFLLQGLSTCFAWSILSASLPYANSYLLARSHFKYYFFIGELPAHSVLNSFPPTLSSFIYSLACCGRLNYWPCPLSFPVSIPFSLTRVAVLWGKGEYSDLSKAVG